MKILILNQAFYPDVVSTAQHAADLALALSKKGHDVVVICSSRGYDNPRVSYARREVWNGIRIARVWSTGLGKAAKWRRAVNFGTFIATCTWRLLLLPKSDVAITMTSPPLISFLAALVTPFRIRRLVFWSMDLNPDEAIAAGWLREQSLVARALSWMLMYSLRRAECIIALDRFMKKRLERKGIPHNKIIVVPPWSHDDHVHFDQAGRDSFRSTHDLTSKFVVMYSGNHSPCHPLATLINAAELLSTRSDIIFCFVGGGSEFQKVKARAKDRGLANVLCLPYQAMDGLSASLSAADLHVVVMGNQFVGLVHPCKIYNILAVRKPFLYIGPAESHLTDIIRNQIAEGGLNAYMSAHGAVEDAVTKILTARKGALTSPLPPSCPVNKHFLKGSLMPQMLSVIERRGSKGATASLVTAEDRPR